MRINQKDQWINCLHCHNQFGTTKPNGKKVRIQSRGLCNTCYNILLYKEIEVECRSCKEKGLWGVKLQCISCYEKERHEYYSRAENKAKSYKYNKKHKDLKELPRLSKDTFEEIRRLLVKYKLGMFNRIDLFRMADHFMNLFPNDFFLDTYSTKEQLRIMNLKLTEIWKLNREYELEKPKRKYRKKVRR